MNHMMRSFSERRLWRMGMMLTFILCVILAVPLLLNLSVLISGARNAMSIPAVMGITPLAVRTDTMSGTEKGHIEAGDLIFIQPAIPDSLQNGDVVAFFEGKNIVACRIVGVEETDGELCFFIKGDANQSEEVCPLAAGAIIGVVAGRVPFLGNLISFVQKPLHVILFAVHPLLFFGLLDLLEQWIGRGVKRKRKKEKGDNGKTAACFGMTAGGRKLRLEADNK